MALGRKVLLPKYEGVFDHARINLLHGIVDEIQMRSDEAGNPRPRMCAR